MSWEERRVARADRGERRIVVEIPGTSEDPEQHPPLQGRQMHPFHRDFSTDESDDEQQHTDHVESLEGLTLATAAASFAGTGVPKLR